MCFEQVPELMHQSTLCDSTEIEEMRSVVWIGADIALIVCSFEDFCRRIAF